MGSDLFSALSKVSLQWCTYLGAKMIGSSSPSHTEWLHDDDLKKQKKNHIVYSIVVFRAPIATPSGDLLDYGWAAAKNAIADAVYGRNDHDFIHICACGPGLQDIPQALEKNTTVVLLEKNKGARLFVGPNQYMTEGQEFDADIDAQHNALTSKFQEGYDPNYIKTLTFPLSSIKPNLTLAEVAEWAGDDERSEYNCALEEKNCQGFVRAFMEKFVPGFSQEQLNDMAPTPYTSGGLHGRGVGKKKSNKKASQRR